MPISENRTKIIVAIIGVVGTITVALIANLSGLFNTSSNAPDPVIVMESQYIHKKKIERFEIEPVIDSRYQGTFGFRYAGNGVKLSAPDDTADNRDSKLILLEDDNPLGPAHSGHADIQQHGRGRYSHWNDSNYTYLYFSASDNSDPRENMRVYSVAIKK